MLRSKFLFAVCRCFQRFAGTKGPAVYYRVRSQFRYKFAHQPRQDPRVQTPEAPLRGTEGMPLERNTDEHLVCYRLDKRVVFVDLEFSPDPLVDFTNTAFLFLDAFRAPVQQLFLDHLAFRGRSRCASCSCWPTSGRTRRPTRS